MSELIVRADLSDDKDIRKAFVTNGLECGISRFILRKEDADFTGLGRMDAIFSENGAIDDSMTETVLIDSPEAQNYALSLAGKKRSVIVSTADWRIIPLENIIAGFADSGTGLYVCTSEIDDVRLLNSVMEKGADGIILDIDDPSKIEEFADAVRKSSRTELSELTVVSVTPVEMGDRVCVDTCVMMQPGEGMLIGSYSDCLFLIQSESEENGYVASRPFRVNAGAVHSYIAAPNDRTRYLSEIESGEMVLVCNRDGRTRSAAVGRCKIERRPLLMIAATDGTRNFNVILQNAETVKMVGKNGSISVAGIGPGDKVLAKMSTGGRHFGMTVEETVSER